MSIITEINKIAVTSINEATVFTSNVDLTLYVKIRGNSKVVWYKSTKYVGRNLFLDVKGGIYWYARII